MNRQNRLLFESQESSRNGGTQGQATRMGHTAPRMARETYRQIADPELYAAAEVFDVTPQVVEKQGALLTG